MSRNTLVIALWVASALWFAGMTVFVQLRLAPEGATPLPDMRMIGYNANWLAGWMAGMSDAGRTLVLGPYRLADSVFPLLLASALVLTGGRRHWWLGVLGLGYAALDLAENAAIAAILRAAPVAPGIDDATRASAFTLGKWGILLLALPAGVVLLARRLKGGG